MKSIYLFVPCYIDHLLPTEAEKMVLVLEHLGYTVVIPTKQPCCGQLAYNNGYFEEAKIFAKKWLQFFAGKQPIIVGGASCAYMIKHIYPELFPSEKHSLMFVEDFLTFLSRHSLPTYFSPNHRENIAVHQSCTGMRKLYNGQNLLLDILSSFNQLNIIQTNVDSQCCGFGGTFSIKYPELSADMGLTKLQEIIKAGSTLLVVSDASCYLHLKGIAEKHQLSIQITTIVDFLFNSIKK